jgi:protein-S-isoprenylcysteine O-methyltransferase Ste14
MWFDIPGSFLFAFLFFVRIDQGLQGSWTAWLLALQSGVVAILLVFHRPTSKHSSLLVRSIAWLSVVAPLAMDVPDVFVVSVPGLLLTIWSLIAIRDSFSISPCDRGLVQRGPYRFIRHPMYAGELLSTFFLCIVSISSPNWGWAEIWNIAVLAIFVFTISVRIVEEEKIIAGYSDYEHLVPWRLIPLVW